MDKTDWMMATVVVIILCLVSAFMGGTITLRP